MNDLEIVKTISAYQKPILSLIDLEKILQTDQKSLRTKIMRLVKRDVLQKVGRGWYGVFGKTVIPEEVAAQLYYPSYISLKTVLSKAGVINQIPTDIFLVTSNKTYQTKLLESRLIFRQIKKELFFGYFLDKGVPIAYPEKALLDLLYFVSYGKDTVSLDELDLKYLNKSRWNKFKRLYPKRVDKLISQVDNLL